MPAPAHEELYDVRLNALGVPITIRSHGASASYLRSAVEQTWQDCRREDTLHQPALMIDIALRGEETCCDEGAVTGGTVEEVLHELASRITLEAIHRQAGKLIMLHACGLADSDTGATIALTGSSGTGKTTAAHVLAGHLGYVTDETVGIRPDLTVEPYPKPLSLVVDGERHKHQRSASSLGLRVRPPHLRLASVVRLVRDGKRRHEVEVETTSTVRGVFELGPEVSYVGMGARPLHRLADLLERTGGLKILHYSEASDLLPVLKELLTS